MDYFKVFLKRSSFCLFVCLYLACSGSEKIVVISSDTVVAEVNGKDITVEKLRDEIRLLMRQFRVVSKNDLTYEEKILLKTRQHKI